jgi:hypothetical protein
VESTGKTPCFLNNPPLGNSDQNSSAWRAQEKERNAMLQLAVGLNFQSDCASSTQGLTSEWVTILTHKSSLIPDNNILYYTLSLLLHHILISIN